MFKSKVNAGASVLPVVDQGRPYLGVRAAVNPSSQEDALKQALLAVVQLWEDRLQKQGVVTTFFITIDSLLFSLASPTRSTDLHGWSVRDQVINASLGGAIIFHVCASIVAYSASFVLIKYQLNDAEKKEEKYFPTTPGLSRAPSTSQYTPQSTEKPSHERSRRKHSSHSHRPSASQGSTLGPSNPIETITDFPLEVLTDLRGLVSIDRAHPLWFLPCGRRAKAARDRDQEQVRARGARDPEAMVGHAAGRLKDMIDVLSRAHVVCTGMSIVGFVLALLGILTYAWTAVPLALSIFASACLGVCAVVATVALW